MKHIIILAAAIAFINSAQAQIQVGVKAGPSLIMNKLLIDAVSPNYKDTISMYIVDDLTPHLGLSVGLLINKKFSEKISIQTEALYSIKQRNFYKLQYLSIPILFKYNLNQQIAFHTGPEVDILLFNQLVMEHIDVSANVGLSYKLNKILFDLRYVYGFIPSYTVGFLNKNGEMIGEVYQKNRSTQLTLAYLF